MVSLWLLAIQIHEQFQEMLQQRKKTYAERWILRSRQAQITALEMATHAQDCSPCLQRAGICPYSTHSTEQIGWNALFWSCFLYNTVIYWRKKLNIGTSILSWSWLHGMCWFNVWCWCFILLLFGGEITELQPLYAAAIIDAIMHIDAIIHSLQNGSIDIEEGMKMCWNYTRW